MILKSCRPFGQDHATKRRKIATLTLEDDRQNYGEPRLQTYGLLGRRLVMVVWTQRGTHRHVISMRKCNAREKARFQAHLG